MKRHESGIIVDVKGEEADLMINGETVKRVMSDLIIGGSMLRIRGKDLAKLRGEDVRSTDANRSDIHQQEVKRIYTSTMITRSATTDQGVREEMHSHESDIRSVSNTRKRKRSNTQRHRAE